MVAMVRDMKLSRVSTPKMPLNFRQNDTTLVKTSGAFAGSELSQMLVRSRTLRRTDVGPEAVSESMDDTRLEPSAFVTGGDSELIGDARSDGLLSGAGNISSEAVPCNGAQGQDEELDDVRTEPREEGYDILDFPAEEAHEGDDEGLILFKTPRWNHDGHAGTLKVTVIAAFDIKAANSSAQGVLDSDGYVYVDVAGQRLRTPAIEENANPVWNCTLTFCLDDKHLSGHIAFSVWDEDEPDENGKNCDDFLGKYVCPIAPVIQNGIFEFSQEALLGTDRGRISAKLQFLPKASKDVHVAMVR